MEEKSKIEKLVFAGDLIENELERIRIKINKIIEVLNRPTLINYPINTQPQAGEYPQKAKYISGEVPEEKKTLVQLRRVFDKKRVKEWDRIAMETYKQATQSTISKAREDALKGKLFDKVTVNTEADIPKELLDSIMSKAKKETLDTAKEIIDGKSIYSNSGCGTTLELLDWFIESELDKLNKKK